MRSLRNVLCLLNPLAIDAFNDLLEKYGKRQSVEKPLLD
jgi:hypothetical protein